MGTSAYMPTIHEPIRQVLIGVSLALIAAARIDPTTVSTPLQMFADGNAPNEDAKAILREIAEGVQVYEWPAENTAAACYA